jgi:hypothetical protein
VGTIWGRLLETVISATGAALVGYLISQLQIRSRLERQAADIDHRLVQPLREKVATMETAALNYVTRAELEKDMQRLEKNLRDLIGLLREDIRDLAAKMDRRP